MGRMHLFEGAITASGFASGHSVVVGAWARSPLGPFVDVMWRDSAGCRRLLAPTPEVAAYVADLYRFDSVEVVGVRGGVRGSAVGIDAGPLRVRALLAPRDWRSWLFALRPRVLRRNRRWISLEDRLARPFVGALLGGGPATAGRRDRPRGAARAVRRG